MHEAQLHELNSYITLTYRDASVSSPSLQHGDFQKFMKRLRQFFRRKKKIQNIRFYMGGEYGELNRRPHFHALIFGADFLDKYPWRKNANGDQLYRSPELETLWTLGDSTLGAVTFESAAYVARYVMKKITGDLAEPHYTHIDENGEIHHLKPEYNTMSRRPAIGKNWLNKYFNDVYPQDHVISNGHPSKPPRYYDKELKRQDDKLFESIKTARTTTYRATAADNTPRRLAAKEKVAAARLAKLKKTL